MHGERPDGKPKCSRAKKTTGLAVGQAGVMKSAITYFPAEQYHRQQELNFCVRDGNRCLPLLVFTDKSRRRLSPAPRECLVMK